MNRMVEAYDAKLAPEPFGLQNTGAICYFNSILQALMSCTSFTRAVLANPEHLRGTKTGLALQELVRAYANPATTAASARTAAPAGARRPHAPGIMLLSASLLAALLSDLAARRPKAVFGTGQQSASEALVLLLDMLEPEPDQKETKKKPDPFSELFRHRYRCRIQCRECKLYVSTQLDPAINFNLFYFDGLTPPRSDDAFAEALRKHSSETTDYKCANCNKPVTADREYTLELAPEILACTFNLYEGYGGQRRARYLPSRIRLPGKGKTWLLYRLVGQVEHFGTLSSGHYTARALRADGKTYLFNDNSFSPSTFEGTGNTYIVFFHFEGVRSSLSLES